MIRFVHTSDWQLGMTRHFLSEEAQARFAQARLDAIRTVGDLAKDRNCEFVVVAGDIFETNQVSQQTISRALHALQSCPVPVFLLPGNHDPYRAACVYTSSAFQQLCPPHVHVLSDSTPFVLRPGVEIIGAPWFSKQPTCDLVEAATKELEAEPNTLRVVVAHGAVSSLVPSLNNPAIIDQETAEAAIQSGAFHYLALGDRHSCTNVGDTGRIWYSGAPEPTDFRETDAGTALVVSLDHEKADVERIDTGTWTFHYQQVELETSEDLESFREQLNALPAKERCIVKLALVGTLDLEQWATLEGILGDATDLFASVNQWERHMDLHLVPQDTDFESLSLSGYAAAARDQLLHEAETGDRVAQDALRLLVRFARRTS